MNTKSSRFLLLVGVASLIVAVVAVVHTSYQPKVTHASSTQQNANFGNWHYQYRVLHETDGSATVMVRYPKASAADVQLAAQAMNAEADLLAGSTKAFPAELVFTHPLSVQEFLDFVAATGIQPTESIVRGIDADGTRSTLGIPPVWKDGKFGQLDSSLPAFDTDALQRLQSGQSGQGRTILGVVTTTVTLNATTYQKVRGDVRVYAVGTLADMIAAELHHSSPTLDLSRVTIQPSNLYWAMEDTGIAPPAVKP